LKEPCLPYDRVCHLIYFNDPSVKKNNVFWFVDNLTGLSVTLVTLRETPSGRFL
jgi:hypothetical protein